MQSKHGKHRVGVQPAPEEPTFWEKVILVFKGIGMLCYVTCPPVPELITRKLAFHPPKKGKWYVLKDKEQPENVIKSARELQDKEIEIIPAGPDCTQMLRNTSVFTTTNSKGNVLVGVHTKSSRPSRERSIREQIILFAQPNSSDLGGFLYPHQINLPNLAEWLECEMIAFDYSGFGYSTGSPSENSIYCDIRAVYDYIREKFPTKKIVLLGYSIGTTCVIDLASTRPEGLAGVILLAPFTSGLRLFKNYEKSCCMDRFTSLDKIEHINVPTLICHGTEDIVVPCEHGLTLHENLSRPVAPLIVHGANHLSLFDCAPTWNRIDTFLRFETDVSIGEPPSLESVRELMDKWREEKTEERREIHRIERQTDEQGMVDIWEVNEKRISIND